jgi:hypothetical protein
VSFLRLSGISGGAGDDAKHYQERGMHRALDAVKEN